MPARIGKSMTPAILPSSRFGYILYPANFPGLGRGLDLLLLLFFHQGKKRRTQKASLPRHICLSTPINHKKKRLLPVGCRGATAYAPLAGPKGPLGAYLTKSFAPYPGRLWGVFNTPLPYRQEKAFNPLKQIGIHTYPASPMPARIGKSMTPAILPSSRFGYILYPANFPGLGRGLDLLLPSFLLSREEKKNPESKSSPSRFSITPNQP